VDPIGLDFVGPGREPDIRSNIVGHIWTLKVGPSSIHWTSAVHTTRRGDVSPFPFRPFPRSLILLRRRPPPPPVRLRRRRRGAALVAEGVQPRWQGRGAQVQVRAAPQPAHLAAARVALFPTSPSPRASALPSYSTTPSSSTTPMYCASSPFSCSLICNNC
jgi:hypothetical protein